MFVIRTLCVGLKNSLRCTLAFSPLQNYYIAVCIDLSGLKLLFKDFKGLLVIISEQQHVEDQRAQQAGRRKQPGGQWRATEIQRSGKEICMETISHVLHKSTLPGRVASQKKPKAIAEGKP